MPELPEVEILRRQLARKIIGKKIVKIKILRVKSFLGRSEDLIGKKIKQVKRRAKILIFCFGKKAPLLLCHLKMTGQLVFKGKYGQKIVGGHPTPDWINKLPSKHTRVMITFADKSKLFFNDMRTFGWMKLKLNKNEKFNINRIIGGKYGPEPLTKEFSFQYLKKKFSRTRRAIKTVLLDQQVVAGIGNIYANDALYKASILPTKSADKLDSLEIKKLRKAINAVIKLGIKYGGASDNTYRHLDGLGGSYQKHFLVYKKNGQKCQRCQTIIKRTKIGGRGTFWCPKCQQLSH